MANFKMIITTTGKHPPEKWAELAADEIIEISGEASATKVKEAKDFRVKLVEMLTDHHQYMMDHEQEQIVDGKCDLNLPYETEEYAEQVAGDICVLTKSYSFEEYFKRSDIRVNLEIICN